MTILERLRDAEVEIKQLRQELAEQRQENAKLRETLRRFAVESKWRKTHTETRFATSDIEWVWQFAESPCEIAKQALQGDGR